MGDPWFDLCCFVLMLSASQAFLFRINASTGGLDIVAMIISKLTHIEIGTCVTFAGAIVCLTGFFIPGNTFRMVVIGIIGTWLNGLAIDYFMSSLNKRKRVCIVSKDNEIIRKFIIEQLVRGCTLYEIKGGYSGERGVEIQALLTQHEYGRLMEYIEKNHIQAFITAGNCSEIHGKWFQHKLQKKLARESEVTSELGLFFEEQQLRVTKNFLVTLCSYFLFSICRIIVPGRVLSDIVIRQALRIVACAIGII